MNNGLSGISRIPEQSNKGSAPKVIGRPAAGPRSRTEGSQRNLPAVEKVLQRLGKKDLPRAVLVSIARRELAALRKQRTVAEPTQILARIQAACDHLRQTRLQAVINGTGILLHTNLGRAPLGSEVVRHVADIASHYNTLEYDLAAGVRGSRATYLESSLALLCQAEAATVTNNCAAALMLVLRHLTARKPEVIISRGELIQIGGGFRIPEILQASGAALREIGTTNKTTLEDYANALTTRTGLILKVHRSNFFMDGFVECPTTQAIATFARSRRVAFVEDLGSGAMVRTERIPQLEHEPTPSEILKQGASLVTFSGDKLMGGPQAGIIAGKARLISGLKQEPLFRALRCDKLVLAALERTVELYLDAEPESFIPALEMMQIPQEALRRRGERLIHELEGALINLRLGTSRTPVGGGTLPRSSLPSITLDLRPETCEVTDFAKRLRQGVPPVVAQVTNGVCRIHLRTVLPGQDEELAAAIRAAASIPKPPTTDAC